jgi:hypothetical protein
MITTILDSTKPKCSNTKILRVTCYQKRGMPHKNFLIFWWKVIYVFIRLEDTLRCLWMVGWLGDPTRFVFYVALAYTHFRKTF